jgi:hypothetical protein
VKHQQKIKIKLPVMPGGYLGGVMEKKYKITPYPLFEWYPQSNEILLNLSMKC